MMTQPSGVSPIDPHGTRRKARRAKHWAANRTADPQAASRGPAPDASARPPPARCPRRDPSPAPRVGREDHGRRRERNRPPPPPLVPAWSSSSHAAWSSVPSSFSPRPRHPSPRMPTAADPPPRRPARGHRAPRGTGRRDVRTALSSRPRQPPGPRPRLPHARQEDRLGPGPLRSGTAAQSVHDAVRRPGDRPRHRGLGRAAGRRPLQPRRRLSDVPLGRSGAPTAGRSFAESAPADPRRPGTTSRVIRGFRPSTCAVTGSARLPRATSLSSGAAGWASARRIPPVTRCGPIGKMASAVGKVR